MKCGNCGAELHPDDTFCGYCGTRATGMDESSAPSKYNTDSNSACFELQQKNDNVNNRQKDRDVPQNKSNNRTLKTVIAVVLISLIVIFTVFNALLVTDHINTGEIKVLDEYKKSLSGFLNISTDSESDVITEENTQFTTAPVEQTTQQSVETTTANPQNNTPDELQQYASGLVYDGKTYRIVLEESDWYINYRSSPEYIEINKNPNNILGKLKHGTEISVEYVYNGTWAVFYLDGRYVFSSMYASNNPSMTRLMEVK